MLTHEQPIAPPDTAAARIEALLASATAEMRERHADWMASKYRTPVIEAIAIYGEFTRADGVAIGVQLALDELTGGGA